MFKYLNKGISAPIAIVIILLLALLVGGITLWQYSKIQNEEVGSKFTEQEEQKKLAENETEIKKEMDSASQFSEIQNPGEIADQINYADVVTDFCKNKEGYVNYNFNLLNFDNDIEKEILVICTEFERDLIGAFIEGKNLYILDEQNDKYKLIWEKKPSEYYNDVRTLRQMSKPEIYDIDGDTIDEIYFTGSNWGGVCSWNLNIYFLYSPKYNEFFDIQILSDVINDCDHREVISSTFSKNFLLEKFKIFKNFLEKKTSIATTKD